MSKRAVATLKCNFRDYTRSPLNTYLKGEKVEVIDTFFRGNVQCSLVKFSDGREITLTADSFEMEEAMEIKLSADLQEQLRKTEELVIEAGVCGITLGILTEKLERDPSVILFCLKTLQEEGRIERELSAHSVGDDAWRMKYPAPEVEAKDWLDSDEVFEALGTMNFRTGPLAHLYQELGEGPAKKCEAEQAFILRKFLKLIRDHGAKWSDVFSEELDQVIKRMKAKRVAEVEATAK